MNGQENVELIVRLYGAFGRGDIPAVLSMLDPQANLHFEGPSGIPWCGTWRGHEGWLKFFETLSQNLEEITVSMEPFAAQGGNVVMAGRYQARAKSTGRTIDSPLVHLWTVRNGLIVGCLEMTNTATELAACTSIAASE
jgi:ketosteroid isomerase-like protein